MWAAWLVLSLAASARAVLYSLNESQYEAMPPLYELERLTTSCQLYCLVDAELYSEAPSPLLQLLQEYSAQTIKHFNHTLIHRGVCASEGSGEAPRELERALETRLNRSTWRRYELRARVRRVAACAGAAQPLDAAEIAVAAVCLLLLLLNAAGTWCHRRHTVSKHTPGCGTEWLLAFSLQRNWTKLTSVAEPDTRKDRLKVLHSLRSMTLVCVLFSHTVLVMAHGYIDNPLYIEKAYDDPLKYILFNGSLVTQTFFLMSSFLLAYNYRVHAETHRFSWLNIPRGVLNRWFRLTPTYALVLGFISTWMVRLGAGPQWPLVVGGEADACRTYWWTHLLYVNNYVYSNAHCMPQTWYLAADTQLFVVGLVLTTLGWRWGARAARWLLGAALLAGLLTVALHTYIQELPPVVLQSPESYRSLYAQDDTFRVVYIRGHTNLAAYAIGLLSGHFYYTLQKERGHDLRAFRRYRWAYWALFPLGVGVILSGGWFYADGYTPPTLVAVLYAALYKPLFISLVALFLVGTCLKVDDLYRGLVEWSGWRVCGRLSYCGFLLHTLFQRGLVGATHAPIHMSDYYIMMVLCGTVLLTFLTAFPLCLLVEMPLCSLQRLLLAPRTPPRQPQAHRAPLPIPATTKL